MDGNFALALPYPTVSGVINQRETGWLYDLYAGRFSELSAICAYEYQSVFSQNNEKVLYILNGIAKVEMLHLKLFAHALFNFGNDPVFSRRYNFFSGSYVNYQKNMIDFLQEDIQAEEQTIKNYKEFARYTQNESLCELLSRIALDEELHVNLLTECFNCLQCES